MRSMVEGPTSAVDPSVSPAARGCHLPVPGRIMLLRHPVEAARLAQLLAVEAIAVQENRLDVAEIAEILRDVAIDEDDVGSLSARDRTDAVVHPGHPSRDDRRGL